MGHHALVVLQHLAGVAAGRAAADLRDAQVAGVDEADELRRLVVEQGVGAHGVGRRPPGLGETRMDVGHGVRWRVASPPWQSTQPMLTVSFSCGSWTFLWQTTQPALLAAASSFVCRRRFRRRGRGSGGGPRRRRRGGCRRRPRATAARTPPAATIRTSRHPAPPCGRFMGRRPPFPRGGLRPRNPHTGGVGCVKLRIRSSARSPFSRDPSGERVGGGVP